MTGPISSKLRRLFLFGGLSLAVGAPILACGGGEATDEATDGEEEPGEEGLEDVLKSQEWLVRPTDETTRSLMIIASQIENRPGYLKKVEPLSDEEQALLEAAKMAAQNPDSPEVKAMKDQIKMLRNTRMKFEDGGKGYADFDGDRTDFKWSASNATDTMITVNLTYPDGYVETHTLTKDGAEFTDKVTTPSGTIDLVLKDVPEYLDRPGGGKAGGGKAGGGKAGGGKAGGKAGKGKGKGGKGKRG